MTTMEEGLGGRAAHVAFGLKEFQQQDCNFEGQDSFAVGGRCEDANAIVLAVVIRDASDYFLIVEPPVPVEKVHQHEQEFDYSSDLFLVSVWIFESKAIATTTAGDLQRGIWTILVARAGDAGAVVVGCGAVFVRSGAIVVRRCGSVVWSGTVVGCGAVLVRSRAIVVRSGATVNFTCS